MPGLNGNIETDAVNMHIDKEAESKLPVAVSVPVTSDDGPVTLSIKTEVGQGHPERKRRASDELSVDVSLNVNLYVAFRLVYPLLFKISVLLLIAFWIL